MLGAGIPLQPLRLDIIDGAARRSAGRPGARIDFGLMARVTDADGKKRRLWALIVTLSLSRYMDVWPTFTQTVEDLCAGLACPLAFPGEVGLAHLRRASPPFHHGRRPRCQRAPTLPLSRGTQQRLR